jgi:hypothetical protein
MRMPVSACVPAISMRNTHTHTHLCGTCTANVAHGCLVLPLCLGVGASHRHTARHNSSLMQNLFLQLHLLKGGEKSNSKHADHVEGAAFPLWGFRSLPAASTASKVPMLARCQAHRQPEAVSQPARKQCFPGARENQAVLAWECICCCFFRPWRKHGAALVRVCLAKGKSNISAVCSRAGACHLGGGGP